MADVKELERKYEELGKEIEKLKSGDKLRLEVLPCNGLLIEYKNGILGFIRNNGNCIILSSDGYVSAYNQWRADGMPIDEIVVKWRGGEYQLVLLDGDIILRRKDCFGCNIYNLSRCCACEYCSDSNIKRFKHNDRPVIY